MGKIEKLIITEAGVLDYPVTAQRKINEIIDHLSQEPECACPCHFNPQSKLVRCNKCTASWYAKELPNFCVMCNGKNTVCFNSPQPGKHLHCWEQSHFGCNNCCDCGGEKRLPEQAGREKNNCVICLKEGQEQGIKEAIEAVKKIKGVGDVDIRDGAWMIEQEETIKALQALLK